MNGIIDTTFTNVKSERRSVITALSLLCIHYNRLIRVIWVWKYEEKRGRERESEETNSRYIEEEDGVEVYLD